MIMMDTMTNPKIKVKVDMKSMDIRWGDILYVDFGEGVGFGQEFKLDTNGSELNDEIRQIIREVYNKPDMSNELITTYLRAYSVYKKEYLERL